MLTSHVVACRILEGVVAGGKAGACGFEILSVNPQLLPCSVASHS
jgi:hypothetical protein